MPLSGIPETFWGFSQGGWRQSYSQLIGEGFSEENRQGICKAWFFLCVFFVFFLILFIFYIFIFGCVGSSFLCEGFL